MTPNTFNLSIGEFSEEYRKGWRDGHRQTMEDMKWLALHKDFTNKEMIELLSKYPEDAIISVECCDPKHLVYDEENNLIRID